MKKIFSNILKYYIFIVILLIWQILSYFSIIPKYLLPSPQDVLLAFLSDVGIILEHTYFTLSEALIGLILGIVIAFILSISMDRFNFVKKSTLPVLIVSQTIPTIAIAPLVVIWFGYGIASKIVLVTLTTFFPITISLLEGYGAVNKDSLTLLKAMGASKFQEFIHLKLPASMPYFFSGLKIAASYSIIAAVITEWLGGFYGLGVYITRVRRAYSFDKMFAVIFYMSIITLVLIKIVSMLEKKIIKWEEK